MRFLLNPVKRTPRAARKECKVNPNNTRKEISPSVSQNDASYLNSWGQQCSPNCGCVVRFETKVDPATQTIVDSSYHAKSIITVPRNGRLEPVLTTRTQKPMLKECKCKTVHTLAKEITSYLPDKNLDRIRNGTEFTFTRSSPAFRHAVLAGNKLPRTDTHCFDVLEEAFTAMVKGVMPKQRRNNKSFEKLLIGEFALNAKDEDFDSSRKEFGMDRTRLSLSSPRTMSTLSMFDINADYWDHENALYDDDDGGNFHQSNHDYDWVSYVDELNKDKEPA